MQADDRALARQGDPARQARARRRKAEALGPAHRHHRRSTTWPTSTSWSRRSPRTSTVKTALFENLDEICKPGAILATTTSAACRSSSCAAGDPAAAGRRRHALLQPRAGDEAGRGGLHGLHRRRRRRRPSARCAPSVGKDAGAPAATGPASSSTRCCSPTSTTRCKMLEAHYADRRRHRHRDEAGLRAADGARSSCSTWSATTCRWRSSATLYLEFREPGFAPAPLLEHLVTAGYLGRKTGRGFRTYG